MNEFEGWQKILLEWKEVNRMKRLNQELYDLLGGALIYTLEHAEKNNIQLPNRDALHRMADRIHYLIDEIEPSPTKPEQPDRDTRKGNTTRFLVVLN